MKMGILDDCVIDEWGFIDVTSEPFRCRYIVIYDVLGSGRSFPLFSLASFLIKRLDAI
jgi:hypothetical protein